MVDTVPIAPPAPDHHRSICSQGSVYIGVVAGPGESTSVGAPTQSAADTNLFVEVDLVPPETVRPAVGSLKGTRPPRRVPPSTPPRT